MRRSYFVRNRIEWELHVQALHQEGINQFRRMYRMRHESFIKLTGYVRPILEKDEKMSKIRTNKGPITVEIILHCYLRWLAGGSYLDIRISAGISIASFYRCLHSCAEAILTVKELAYHFPATTRELRRTAKDFKKISSYGLIDGCIGCLDGLLLKIQVPSSKDCGHVKSFHSGHYGISGINVQAVCDAKCRFTFAALAAPGGQNDIKAFRGTKLFQYLDSTPIGKYIIGDNAYVCGEHLLTPFPGQQRSNTTKDAYNFFLSQLRIRIEMTFGRFVNKWRVFLCPLRIKLKFIGPIFMSATRLHNFCINEEELHRQRQQQAAEGWYHGIQSDSSSDEEESDTDDSDSDDDDDSVASSTSDEEAAIPDTDIDVPPGEIPAAYLPSDHRIISIAGHSIMREILVDEVSRRALARPSYNINRNKTL